MNKQNRGKLTHSNYSVESGHGGMKRNRTMGMGAGASIRPQSEESSGMARFKGRKKAAASGGGGGNMPNAKPMDTDTESGWAQIGEAGGEIAGEYVRRRKARQSRSSGGGRGSMR